MDGHLIAAPVVIDTGTSDEAPAARLGALFDAHHARLFRLARRLAHAPEDPDDIVQETFLRAARALDRVPSGRTSEEAWLVRVLINVCKDAWRQRAVRTRAALDGRLRPDQSQEAEGPMFARAVVWQALDRLPPRRRAILVMYEIEGAAIPAIAQLVGVSPVTVRWHLMMGRREMARALGGTR